MIQIVLWNEPSISTIPTFCFIKVLSAFNCITREIFLHRYPIIQVIYKDSRGKWLKIVICRPILALISTMTSSRLFSWINIFFDKWHWTIFYRVVGDKVSIGLYGSSVCTSPYLYQWWTTMSWLPPCSEKQNTTEHTFLLLYFLCTVWQTK